MGGVIFIVVIIYLVASRFSGKNGINGDHKDYSAKAKIVVIWIVAFLSLSVGLRNMPEYGYDLYLIILLIPVLLLPGLISFFTAKLGLVKTSYYLAGLAAFQFRRNIFSGQLIRGVEACSNLKNNDEKRKQLRWLKTRYSKRDSKLLSGEMIAITIIESHLIKPGDIHHMAQQLDLLDGLAQASIPRKLSVYALKLSLASSFTRENKAKTLRRANQWNTPAANALAKYIIELDYIHQAQNNTLIGRIRCCFWGLFVRKNPLIVSLEQSYKPSSNHQNRPQEASPLELLQSNPELSTEQQEKCRGALLRPEQHQKWLARARDLGVWNENEAWESISTSVEKQLSLANQSGQIEDDENYLKAERSYKNLHYLVQSIERRVDEKSLGSAVQNFQDWMKVQALLQDLASDDQLYETAFSTHHAVLWQWVADQWNVSKQHCLVHFISDVSAPIASRCGHNDFYELLRGLTLAEYK